MFSVVSILPPALLFGLFCILYLAPAPEEVAEACGMPKCVEFLFLLFGVASRDLYQAIKKLGAEFISPRATFLCSRGKKVSPMSLSRLLRFCKSITPHVHNIISWHPFPSKLLLFFFFSLSKAKRRAAPVSLPGFYSSRSGIKKPPFP